MVQHHPYCALLYRGSRGRDPAKKTTITATMDVCFLNRNKVKVFVLAGGSHELTLLCGETVGRLKTFISVSLALKHRR